MKRFAIGLGALVVSLLFQHCTFDDQESLKEQPCFKEEVSLSRDVRPVLNDYGCTSCHSAQFPSGGVDLENANNIIFEADSGKLLKSINHAPDVAPMPQSQPKMEPCDIQLIERWVEQGAMDN